MVGLNRVLGGEIHGNRFAGHIGTASGIHGNGIPIIREAAAKIGRINKQRINDQRAAAIVIGHGESYTVRAAELVGARHRLAHASDFLVDHGPVETEFPVGDILAARNDQQEIAVRGELRRRTVELPGNAAGIGARGHHKIVLELSLRAVVDEIHARIDALVLHASVGRNVGAPLLRVVANEVIALARQLPRTNHGRPRVGPHQLHA